MAVAHIGLGSNLGDRHGWLEEALRQLRSSPTIERLAVSRYYETRPIGGPPDQPPFLNAAAAVQTSLSPDRLADRLHEIERQLGRQRHSRWGARTIDLDLLLFEDRVVHTPSLVVPHPRLAFRRFVLEPLAEIAPQVRHPVLGWTVQQLLENLIRRPRYVALASLPPSSAAAQATQLHEQTGAEWIRCATSLSQPSNVPADPSPHTTAVLLKWLTSWQRKLDLREPDRTATTWLVSDGWFDQIWIYAHALLDASEQESFRQIWTAARQQVIQPTFVVWIDLPIKEIVTQSEPAEPGSPPRLDANELARLHAAHHRYLKGPHLPPVLEVDGRDIPAGVSEVRTAMNAASG